MNRQERLQQVRCFLMDLDGTLYLGDELIPGALDFLDALQRTGRECLFLTNNSSKSAAYYLQKLRRLGVPENFCRILTSAEAAAAYLNHHFPGQKPYIVANKLVLSELKKLGVSQEEDNPDYVLLTFDTELDYHKLTRLCDCVRQGLPYIATHPDFNCPIPGGYLPDIGATIAYVEASTGRRPDTIIGKPNPGIVEAASLRTGYTIEEMAMVGDRLYTDIATGLAVGMPAILVLSGETTREMLPSSAFQPDYVYGCLKDIVPDLERMES